MKNRILVKDKKGNIIKIYDNKTEACVGEKIGLSTLTRNLRGITKNPENGKFYEWEGISRPIQEKAHNEKMFNRKAVVLLDSNDNFVKEYKSQSDLAKDKGFQQAIISQYLSRSESRPYKNKWRFMYKKDYENLYGILNKEVEEKVAEEEYAQEIMKKKTTEYYVNVLVGLANQTLIDGAIYDMGGTKLVYNKKNDSLDFDGIAMFTKDGMFREVSVELPLLTEKEKEFLTQLVKAFTRINGIRKCKSTRDGFEFIRIETGIDEDIVLPDFREGLYYNNLQQNRLYSVDELEIK